jgi:hypothetical protein
MNDNLTHYREMEGKLAHLATSPLGGYWWAGKRQWLVLALLDSDLPSLTRKRNVGDVLWYCLTMWDYPKGGSDPMEKRYHGERLTINSSTVCEQCMLSRTGYRRALQDLESMGLVYNERHQTGSLVSMDVDMMVDFMAKGMALFEGYLRDYEFQVLRFVERNGKRAEIAAPVAERVSEFVDDIRTGSLALPIDEENVAVEG